LEAGRISTLLYAQKYLHEMQRRDAGGQQKVPSLVIAVTFDANLVDCE
jgi:hypothetical protein